MFLFYVKYFLKTKNYFSIVRAGILGHMEECREDKIATVLSWLQAGARGKASRIEFKKLGDERKALVACQNAMKARQMEKSWKWMELWNLIRPTLKCTNFCKFQETYEAPIKEAEANISKAIKECKEVTEKLASVVASGEMVTALCRT